MLKVYRYYKNYFGSTVYIYFKLEKRIPKNINIDEGHSSSLQKIVGANVWIL